MPQSQVHPPFPKLTSQGLRFFWVPLKQRLLSPEGDMTKKGNDLERVTSNDRNSARISGRSASRRSTARAASGEMTLSDARPRDFERSEEHTSELQSLAYLVCRLLLEKKKKATMILH